MPVSCKKQFTCLTTEDAQNRAALAYSDVSADATKTCDHCQQFVPGEEDCGTCKILKGPIHPKGSCKSFSLKS